MVNAAFSYYYSHSYYLPLFVLLWDHAHECERFVAGVAVLMQLVGLDQDEVAFTDLPRNIAFKSNTLSAENVIQVFALVGVVGCVAAWFDRENPDREVGYTVGLPDRYLL